MPSDADSDPPEEYVSNKTDPFAKRPGHVLAWRNVNMSAKQNGEVKPILEDIAGSVRPKHLCTIMGHSGAGKSSLLNILAGRVRSAGSTNVTSKLLMDDIPINPLDIEVKRKIAFVVQTDTLMSTDTPREALKFSARLRLSKSVTDQEIDALVNHMIMELSLDRVADNYIGGTSFRGLSGGERRRLSLGIELVVRPSILFVDEITSGLDSHTAMKTFKLCQDIARCGTTVVMTIHQPSSQIYEMMDHLVLLRQGRVLYQGQAKDLPTYFADRGYPVPENHNPSDHMVDVAQTAKIEALEAAGFYRDFPVAEVADWEQATMVRDFPVAEVADWEQATMVRNSLLAETKSRHLRMSTTLAALRRTSAVLLDEPAAPLDTHRLLSIVSGDHSNERVDAIRELTELLKREIRYIARDKDGLVLRFGATFGAAVLIALLFADVGNSSSFTSQVGAIYTMVFAVSIGVQFPFLDLANVRLLFVKEFSTDHFRMPIYSAAKILREIVEGAIQVFILVIITYWALDLKGDFGILFAILYLYGMTSVALGNLVAAWVTDTRNASEYLPYLILPQLLLAGFLVSDFPAWLEWTKYSSPLTYAFRLALNNEFDYCVDFTEDDKRNYNCVKSIRSNTGLFRPTHLFNETSVYTLPYTGSYIGQQSIVEYVELVSGDQDPSAIAWDACGVKGTTVTKFHKENKDGCDFSISYTLQGRLNPLVTKDSLWEGYSSPEEGPTWIRLVQGHRIKYTYDNPGPKPVIIHEWNAHLPPAFLNIFGDALDAEKISRATCDIIFNSCPDEVREADLQRFSNQEECVDAFMGLPDATINELGHRYFDGNSTGCRGIHTLLSMVNPEAHCPHISYYPYEDPNGRLKCHESADLRYEEFFEPIDYRLWDYAAESTGFFDDPEFRTGQATDYFLPEDLLECGEGLTDFDAIVGAHVLPENYECAEFLDIQDSVGDANGFYWGVLCAMFIFFRGLAVVGLRRQQHNQNGV